MKNITKAVLASLLLSFNILADAQIWSMNRSIEMYAEIDENSPSITLKWSDEGNTQTYYLYRRMLDSANWGSSISTMTSTDLEYVDTDIEKNKIYEYKLERVTTIVEPFSNNGSKMYAYGFVSAGIQMDVNHFRGNMLILVSKNLNDNLSSELETLRMDLIGDGWSTEMATVPDTADVQYVKSMIDQRAQADSLQAVYLLGEIPVPYSGLYCTSTEWTVPPDGHGKTDNNSHCDAWPSDLYYGVNDGTWTDNDTSFLGKRPENNNDIGDGKFDNIMIPGKVTISIGRVDLSRLSKFTEDEVALTKRYLEKSHEYKYVMNSINRMAILEDNFPGTQEGFSSQAFSDFTAHLGPNSIIKADLFTTTKTDDYLFSYTCGGGSYTSCNGVGNSDSFKSLNPAVFNHMFGSFFGDFDIANNIARSSLASSKNGLVSIWSGRPKWLTHTLAMGETFGDCALRTQNNNWDYSLSFFQNQCHIALLGDPSLRTSMVAPVSNLSSTKADQNTDVNLTWTASTSANITGYYIYWSKEKLGPYMLLNQIPVSTTSFTHFTPEFGDNFYMVRTEKLEQTASGSYFNLSEGLFTSVSGVERTASINNVRQSGFSLYPNPSANQLNIRTSSFTTKKYSVTDVLGKLIIEDETNGQLTQVDLTGLKPGLYFLNLDHISQKFIKL